MHPSRRTAILLSIINLALIARGTSAKNSSVDDTESKAKAIDLPPNYLQLYFVKPNLFGQGKYTFFGFDVYHARLWTEANNFLPETWEQHRFALELTYLRDAEGKVIAKRSIDEISKQKDLDKSKSQSWLNILENLFPNIKKAQTLTGVYTPNNGVKFFFERNLIGEIKDPELTKSFFDIWFSNRTSAPDLRKKLFQGSF
jgi:hypothetical protein